MKSKSSPILIVIAFGLIAFLPKTHAVVPTPDGCYPNYTTAEGCNALNFLTTGLGNTGVGWYSLFSNTDASFNTGIGGGALALNNANSNTAVGAAALLLNTAGIQNTAIGTDALVFNDNASFNSAVGAFALFNNVSGSDNTAVGSDALRTNDIGIANTAVGEIALQSNTSGNFNTAIGENALSENETGQANTAVGRSALFHATGGNNIGIGTSGGADLTTGDSNIDIGNAGVAGESGTVRIGSGGVHTATYIAGISGVTVPAGVTVVVDSGGHLGTMVSSKRFKDEIKPMDKASEAILALKPVTFRYKKELDPESISQFGLVAEEVEKVNPNLVARNAKGEVYTVRYEAVNAMLLNEFLKEYRKVEEQQVAIAELKSELQSARAEQQRDIQTLTARFEQQAAQIQTVSDRIELKKPAHRTVANNE